VSADSVHKAVGSWELSLGMRMGTISDGRGLLNACREGHHLSKHVAGCLVSAVPIAVTSPAHMFKAKRCKLI
jgi:hypothetical protein